MNYPNHVALIMDGNRRWGKLHRVSTYDAYKRGRAVLASILDAAEEKNIKCISCYTFSKENASRNVDDIKDVFKVVYDYFDSILKYGTNRRFIFSGDLNILKDDSLKELLQNVEKATENNDGLIVNIAIGYSSQDEIIRAANAAAKNGEITKELFEKELYTSKLPQLDMIIRTGGEVRLSNFMLYQSAYAELFFVDKLWCDFTKDNFFALLDQFANITRNYGK